MVRRCVNQPFGRRCRGAGKAGALALRCPISRLLPRDWSLLWTPNIFACIAEPIALLEDELTSGEAVPTKMRQSAAVYALDRRGRRRQSG